MHGAILCVTMNLLKSTLIIDILLMANISMVENIVVYMSLGVSSHAFIVIHFYTQTIS